MCFLLTGSEQTGDRPIKVCDTCIRLHTSSPRRIYPVLLSGHSNSATVISNVMMVLMNSLGGGGGGGGGGKDSLKAMQVPDFSSSVSSLEYSVTGTHCMDYATFHRT